MLIRNWKVFLISTDFYFSDGPKNFIFVLDLLFIFCFFKSNELLFLLKFSHSLFRQLAKTLHDTVRFPIFFSLKFVDTNLFKRFSFLFNLFWQRFHSAKKRFLFWRQKLSSMGAAAAVVATCALCSPRLNWNIFHCVRKTSLTLESGCGNSPSLSLTPTYTLISLSLSQHICRSVRFLHFHLEHFSCSWIPPFQSWKYSTPK